MTLQDKLLTLDERITGQFQKITDWGYKRLGWDKYDFAGRAYDISGITLFGQGVYMAIEGLTNRGPNILFGTSAAFLGLHLFYDARKHVKILRELEEEILEHNGAPLPPRYNPSRPVVSVTVPPTIKGIASSFSAPLSYVFYCGAAAFLFTDAASYFRNTTMYPPKKKKTLRDALDWAREKLTLQQPTPNEVKVQI